MAPFCGDNGVCLDYTDPLIAPSLIIIVTGIVSLLLGIFIGCLLAKCKRSKRLKNLSSLDDDLSSKHANSAISEESDKYEAPLAQNYIRTNSHRGYNNLNNSTVGSASELGSSYKGSSNY